MKREFMLEDKVTYEPDEVCNYERVSYQPHQHTKDYICMRITHPDKIGVRIRVLQLNFCQGCGLAWFEELPSVSAFDVAPKARIGNAQ